MRRLLLLVLALLAAPAAYCQSTTVSGTITDQGGQAWFSGTVQFTFRPSNSNPTAQYFWNGAPFDKSTTIPSAPLPLDGTGSFSGVSVPSNNFITPSGSTWTVQVCPASTTACFSQNLTITGATQNISAQIIPPAVNLNLSVPLLGARAYTDSEVTGALPGSFYFNNTDNFIHVCLLTGFPPCTWFVQHGGAGTVTSVSSGNFSPLFNVTVTNPTTTPAFSFTAQNAPANTIYGNPSGSPGPPSFNTPASFSGFGTVTNFSSGNLSPLFTTSVSNPTTTPSLSFALNTQASNTVFAGPATVGGGVVDKSVFSNGNSSAALNLTATPVGTNEFGIIVFASQGASTPTQQGFTLFTTALANISFLGGFFAPASSITYSHAAYGVAFSSSLTLVGTNGSAPTVNSTAFSGNASYAAPTGNTLSAFSSNNVAGNTIFVGVEVTSTTIPSCGVRDTNLNGYSLVSSTTNGLNVTAMLFVARNIVAGANTATVFCNASVTGEAQAVELSNVAAVPGFPQFRALVGSDLPFPTTTSLGGVQSKAAVTHQFLTALDTSGNFTSAQPAAGDISGLGFTQSEAFTFCASGCTVTGTPCSTTTGANNECTNAITLPTPFADTGYAVSCSGAGTITGFPFIPFVAKTSASVVTVTTSNGQGSAAVVSNFGEIDCLLIHP